MEIGKILVLLRFLFIISVLGFSSVVSQEKNEKSTEESAWEDVNSFNQQSLKDFLKKFPAGKLAQHARLAIELQNNIVSIKENKLKSIFTIPFNVLGNRWKSWQERNPNKGAIGYFAKQGEKFNSLGWFSPDPMSGGKTPGGNTISFDEFGIMVSPTGDESIIAFRTDGLKYEFLKGILIETPGDEPIYFAVIKGKGLVHLNGKGKVTLTNGKSTNLK